MTNSEGVYKFLEYLDQVEQNIVLFKGVVTASEIMGETSLSEEQIQVSNAYLNELQKEWSKSFIKLLEFGAEWLKQQDGVETE